MIYTVTSCISTSSFLSFPGASLCFVGLGVIFFLVVRFISVGIVHGLSGNGFSVSMGDMLA